MSTPHIQPVNYERLLQKLAVHACRILKAYGLSGSAAVLVDGLGKSAQDFACDTLILYLSGEVRCAGDEGAIFACLRVVLEHDVVDSLRLSTAKTTQKVHHVSGVTSEAGEKELGLDDFASKDDTAAAVEAKLFKEYVYKLLEKTEPELHDVAYAVFEEDALAPREIAAVIGCDTDEVQNRKKRFRTFMTKHDISKNPAKVSA